MKKILNNSFKSLLAIETTLTNLAFFYKIRARYLHFIPYQRLDVEGKNL